MLPSGVQHYPSCAYESLLVLSTLTHLGFVGCQCQHILLRRESAFCIWNHYPSPFGSRWLEVLAVGLGFNAQQPLQSTSHPAQLLPAQTPQASLKDLTFLQWISNLLCQGKIQPNTSGSSVDGADACKFLIFFTQMAAGFCMEVMGVLQVCYNVGWQIWNCCLLRLCRCLT